MRCQQNLSRVNTECRSGTLGILNIAIAEESLASAPPVGIYIYISTIERSQEQ